MQVALFGPCLDKESIKNTLLLSVEVPVFCVLAALVGVDVVSVDVVSVDVVSVDVVSVDVVDNADVIICF